MPKGAPKGNQYAVKAQKRQGITISMYLDASALEAHKTALLQEGKEPTVENVRKRVKSLCRTILQ